MNLKNNNQLHFELVNSENRMEAENLSVFSEQSGFIRVGNHRESNRNPAFSKLQR